MAFCQKCGAQLDANAKFCTSCGNPNTAAQPTAQPAKASTGNNFFASLNNTADITATMDPADIKQNKVNTILAYIGPCILWPVFMANKTKYSRFHNNQAIILFLLGVGYGICQIILDFFIDLIFPTVLTFQGFVPVYSANPINVVLTILLSLPWLAYLALMILGIVNASQNKAKELPFVGRFKIIL